MCRFAAILKKEVLDMATSSITKNFVVSGDRQAEIFANAIEASANSETPPIGVSVTELRGADEIKKFLERRKKAND